MSDLYGERHQLSADEALQSPLTVKRCALLHTLAAKDGPDLEESFGVIITREEREPSRQEAQQRHSDRPDIQS